MAKEKYIKVCGGIKPIAPIAMLEEDKDPNKPMSEQKETEGQKTIHEKWEDGSITILPPKED